MAHTTVEVALKAKAAQEGAKSEQSLHALLKAAIEHRWISDHGFSAAADQGRHWEEHRQILQLMGAGDCGPFLQGSDDQAYAKQLVHTIRAIRNGVAHGEVMFTHDIAPIFRTIAEFINQLFPEKHRELVG